MGAMAMEYRHLGRTGLKVSALSFGAWVTFGNQVHPSHPLHLCTFAPSEYRLRQMAGRPLARFLLSANQRPKGHRQSMHAMKESPETPRS